MCATELKGNRRIGNWQFSRDGKSVGENAVIRTEINPSLRKNRGRDAFVCLERDRNPLIYDRDGGRSGWLAGEEEKRAQHCQPTDDFHSVIINQASGCTIHTFGSI